MHPENSQIEKEIFREALEISDPAKRDELIRERCLENGEARFRREALVLGQLEHPNIVPIHDIGEDEDGQLCYTMKLVKRSDRTTNGSRPCGKSQSRERSLLRWGGRLIRRCQIVVESC